MLQMLSTIYAFDNVKMKNRVELKLQNFYFHLRGHLLLLKAYLLSNQAEILVLN